MSRLINKQSIIFFCCAFILNIIFFKKNNPHYFYAITQDHGQIAYNFLLHNNIGLNQHLCNDIAAIQKKTNTLIDFAQLETKYEAPTRPFPINDTIGYGFILALLWKITESFRFIDVQFLQMLLYALSIIFFYQIALLLFENKSIAFFATIAQLSFIPLLAQNVQAVRDVWAYYGLIVLLYVLLMFLKQKKSVWFLAMGCSIFAFCQFVRPAVFMAVLTFSFFLMVCFLITKQKKYITSVLVLLLTNFIFFWVPFFAHNYYFYNRLIVGPAGQDLMEGLGEYENPWGFQISDEFVSKHVEKKYGFKYGTQEFDDAAYKEFLIVYHQKPLLFYKNIIRRIPRLIAPSLYAIFMKESPFKSMAIKEKLKKAFSSWSYFFDFLLRHVYVWLFLLISYAGLVFLFFKKNYFALGIILCVLCAGWGKLPSHIDYRYLIPFYWILSLAAGYLVSVIWIHVLRLRHFLH